MMGSVDLDNSVRDKQRGCAIAEALRFLQHMHVPRTYPYRVM